MRIADSNQPYMDKPWFMVLMVDDQIRMFMPELKDEYYLPPVPELEDDEYEEGPGDDDTPEYLLDNKYVSNTEDNIPSQDNN